MDIHYEPSPLRSLWSAQPHFVLPLMKTSIGPRIYEWKKQNGPSFSFPAVVIFSPCSIAEASPLPTFLLTLLQKMHLIHLNMNLFWTYLLSHFPDFLSYTFSDSGATVETPVYDANSRSSSVGTRWGNSEWKHGWEVKRLLTWRY